jgi:hypothetical protein
MPMPSSRTRRIARSRISATLTQTCPPGAVYFSAFASRFVTIWSSRAGRRRRIATGVERVSVAAVLRGLERLGAALDQLAEIDGHALQLHATRLHARDVEQIVDEPRQVSRLAAR